MPPANIESDPFFELLTDALRAGPGSPQWHEAVTKLREQGGDGNDEHRLLIEAREDLENGRDYRAVRAGQGFTRKLMGQIENGSGLSARRGIPMATLVAIVCGVLIVAVIGYVGYRLAPREVTTQQAIQELEDKSHSFFDTKATATFTNAVPEGWQVIGALPLDPTNGLHLAAAAEKDKSLGGGVRYSQALPSSQAFALEVSVEAPQPGGSVLLEAFVSSDANFSADKGTSSHDLVWQLNGGSQHVLLGGSSQHIASPPAFGHGDVVRLIVDQKVAIIEVVGGAGGKPQRLWAGLHELGNSPRYVGVRFLQTGAGGKEDLSVKQIKIITTSAG